MPGPNTPYTRLSSDQVLTQSFDETTDRLRVDAEVTAVIVGPQEVIITATTDNIAIRNSNNINELLINADGSINTVTIPDPDSATSANQVTEIARLTSIDNKTPALVAGRQPVDGSGVIQPISATSLPLPSGASTSALQTSGNASLTSIDGKIPSGLTVSSTRLLVDASGTTQPVSGTITVTQATGTNLHTVIDSSALPIGGSTGALQTSGNASLTSIDGKTPTLGQKTSVNSSPIVLASDQSSIPVTGSGTFTVVQPTGTNLHAVIDSSALPSGASTSALQTTGNASLISIDSKTPVLGQALAAASVPVVLTAAQLSTLTPLTTITVTQATGTNLHTVVDSGTITANIGTTNGLALDTSVNSLLKPASTLNAVTTVGTITNAVTVVQPTGTNLHTVVDSSALPSGASTSALQTAGNASLTSIDSKLTAPLSVTGPLTDTQLRASAVPVSAASLPLPSGASTSALQTSGNASLTSIDSKLTSPITIAQATGTNLHTVVDSSALPTGASTSANQTSGGQKTQIVDGANITIGPVQTINSINHLPVVLPPDNLTAVSNITAQDVASITGTGFGGQPFIIGTPTAGSSVVYNLNSIQSVMLEMLGLWTGTLQIEVSADSGVTYVPRSIHVVGTNIYASAVTANVLGSLNASAKTNLRIRSTAAWTGTATIRAVISDNSSNMYVANAIKLLDGSSTTSTTLMSIKPASTAPVATDPAIVVGLSPNGNQASAINQTNGTQKSQVVDGSGNVLPVGDVASRASFNKLTDGVDLLSITAAGEAQVLVTPLTNTSVVKAQLQDNAGTAIVLGQTTMASSVPVVFASNQSTLSVSGTLNTKSALTPSAPTAASVGIASAQILAATARKGLVLTNTSNARISLGFGVAAILNSGVTVYPGGTFQMDEYSFTVGTITAIASAAASNLGIQEYT